MADLTDFFPLTPECRSELWVVGDVLAMADIITVPFFVQLSRIYKRGSSFNRM
jgi:hypothetical protein